MENIGIEITLTNEDTDEVIEKSISFGFESAEESLGKMRMRYEALLDKLDAQADLQADEIRENETTN